jgi:hypothetical protein
MTLQYIPSYSTSKHPEFPSNWERFQRKMATPIKLFKNIFAYVHHHKTILPAPLAVLAIILHHTYAITVDAS